MRLARCTDRKLSNMSYDVVVGGRANDLAATDTPVIRRDAREMNERNNERLRLDSATLRENIKQNEE